MADTKKLKKTVGKPVRHSRGGVLRLGKSGCGIDAAHKARFGDVGRYHIRGCAKTCHGGGQRGRTGVVKLAVIAEDGIDKHCRSTALAVRRAEAADEVRYDISLPLAAEKAGVYRVKAQSYFIKMIGNARDLLVRFAEVHSAKASGVGREERRRDGNALHSHCRKRGNYHGQRASAKA